MSLVEFNLCVSRTPENSIFERVAINTENEELIKSVKAKIAQNYVFSPEEIEILNGNKKNKQ